MHQRNKPNIVVIVSDLYCYLEWVHTDPTDTKQCNKYTQTYILLKRQVRGHTSATTESAKVIVMLLRARGNVCLVRNHFCTPTSAFVKSTVSFGRIILFCQSLHTHKKQCRWHCDLWKMMSEWDTYANCCCKLVYSRCLSSVYEFLTKVLIKGVLSRAFCVRV